jgi:hypothetical protein
MIFYTLQILKEIKRMKKNRNTLLTKVERESKRGKYKSNGVLIMLIINRVPG